MLPPLPVAMRGYRRKTAAAIAATALLLAACGGGAGGGSAPLPEVQPSALSLLWKAKVGGMAPLLQPALIDGRICTVSQGGLALLTEVADGSQTRLPPVEGESGYTAGAGCRGDIVAAVSGSGWLRVIHAEQGLLWQQDLKTRVYGAPLLANGRVFVVGLDGRVLAYTLRKGREVWRHVSASTAVRTPLESAAVIHNDTLFAGLAGGALVALDPSSGRVKWENEVAAPAGGYNEVANILDVATPAAYGSRVCAAAYQSAVACFNVRSGERLWSQPLAAYTRAAFSADGRWLFATDSGGALHRFDAASGELHWRQETGQALSAPLFAGGHVLAGDGSGALHVFDAASGERVASLNLNGGAVIHLSALPAQPGEFIALSAGGWLHRLRLDL